MRKFFSLFIAILTLQSVAAQITWSEPKVIALSTNEYNIELSAKLEEGWHLYSLDAPSEMVNPTRFEFAESADYKLVGEVTSNDKVIETEIFGYEVSYYKDSVTFQQRVKSTEGHGAKIAFNVEWMLCDDTSCIPPADRDFSVVIGTPTESTASESNSSLWWTIIEAMLWGFAALLTPCVFPMVPMTISFFLKGKEGEERGRAAAALYGLFIVALYTLPIAAIILITRTLGGESVTADIFNWVATHWLPNIIFFVVFVLFALSFFGLFEISLPSSWVNRSDSRAGRGSIAGIFFLSLTLVLVSFSCTGPIVGSVLIKSTSGEFWQPIITMLFFSLAFALPFVAVALSPSFASRLPKSGGWLSSVKIVLGFLELALSLKFLSVADQIYQWNLLSRDLYIVLWIIIFSMLGLYLLGILRIGEGKTWSQISLSRKGLALLSFAFVAYITTGLWGAPLKPLAGYLPPMKSSEYVVTNDLEEAQRLANREGKPLLLDFTGYGCVNCREMEQRVWSDPRVDSILQNHYVVVALYMDDREELPESQWVKTEGGRLLKSRGRVISHFAQQRYGVNSQPTYIPVGKNGEPLTPPRGYNLDIDDYITFLESGITNYKKE